MPDLKTRYLGLDLQNPLVVSACTLCQDLDNIRLMEDFGASAVVLHSLFEEQITTESNALDITLDQGAESFPEAISYFPNMGEYKLGPEEYLEHIRRAKKLVEIPIIASLNGISHSGWVEYARKIEEAGADALELNVYHIATNPETSAAEVEKLYTNLVKAVKKTISIPVAVKIGPFFSSLGNMATQLEEAGSDGLVIFNRFYQPDIDLEELEVVPDLVLSNSTELRLRLRWAAFLADRTKMDLAITGGVHTGEDALKAMMVGGKVAMMTSALYKNGIGHLATVRQRMVEWMEEHEYDSVKQMQGSMTARALGAPDGYARANYLKVLTSYAGKTGGSTTVQ